MAGRRSISSPFVAVLLALTLAGTTFAVGRAASVDARDAVAAQVVSDGAAPDGRLVVIWRTPKLIGAMRLAGAVRVEQGPNPDRSVIVAAPGRSAALAAELRADPSVRAVVPDSLVSTTDFPTSPPNDPYYSWDQADLGLMGVPTAWLTTTGSPAVIVAVLDTGMTRTHEDLDGVPVVSSFNAITGTTVVTDGHGHGTHVIGEIAAETNNGLGVAGIAPGVSIMPIKVLDDFGRGYFSEILDGIDWARAHGATVINMSIGGTLSPDAVAYFQPVIDAAHAAGITIVASAGNDGNGTVSYPASFANVLSVAATDNWDQHASFSNANAKVDLSAPGVRIRSTYKDGRYAWMTGTSMSSPHVAAVAALIRSANPTFTPAQIEQALRTTAIDLGTPGRDNTFGSGRVDAAAAVAWQTGWPTPTPTPTPTPVPAPDTRRPLITRRVPTSGAVTVDRDGNIRITFSEPVRGLTTSTIRLINTKTGHVVRVRSPRYDAATRTVTLDPYSRMTALTSYRVEVRAGIKDAAGNTLATVKWSFRTGRH